MQAVFILTMVTMVMTIIGGIISGGTSNSAQLQSEFKTETRQYFENMARVVLSDITRENLHGNPDNYTTIGDYIRGMPQLKQLSSGRYPDPATDAWGKPIQGRIFTGYEVMQKVSPIDVTIPVTGIAFVSGGPDGIVQTALPNVTQLSQIIGIAAPVSSDDIVLTFNNRRAQEDEFAAMRASLRRIGTASLKELQTRVSSYRAESLRRYQVSITAGIDVSISAINITADPKAPKFLKIDSSNTGQANRRALGVDAEFDSLQRTINGGNMVVITSSPTLLSDPLIIKLQNNALKPTTWGNPRSSFNYQIQVVGSAAAE